MLISVPIHLANDKRWRMHHLCELSTYLRKRDFRTQGISLGLPHSFYFYCKRKHQIHFKSRSGEGEGIFLMASHNACEDAGVPRWDSPSHCWAGVQRTPYWPPAIRGGLRLWDCLLVRKCPHVEAENKISGVWIELMHPLFIVCSLSYSLVWSITWKKIFSSFQDAFFIGDHFRMV